MYDSSDRWQEKAVIYSLPKKQSEFERTNTMKKIMFGNSLMLLGIALLILMGLNIMPIYAFWPAAILVLVGFIMAVIGFFSKDNK